MGVVSELRTPKFFARHGERARWLFGDDEFSNQRRQLFDTVLHVVGCFLIFAGIHKPTIGDRSDAHLCRFRRSNAGERILDYKAWVSRDSKVLRRAQVDVGSGFAAFDFFASNSDLEESGQLMSI